MKKEFLTIALFLGISNIAMAQWPAQGTLGGGLDGGGRMMRQHKPDVQRELVPFIKGDEALAQTWDPNIAKYGNNPDGMTVTCFAEDGDNLYIGGDFRDFDSVAADFIVHYNRKTQVWNALDVGLSDRVRALAVHNGELYAGGDFGYAGSARSVVNNIAMWDGTAWHDLGGGMNSSVYALAFIGDTLYAGGSFSQAGGNTAYGLAYWDGSSWHEAFGGTSYPVAALLATHDSLFVGGNFNYVGSETSNTGIPVHGTAMLKDGQWSPLGIGYYSNCFAMFEGKLWVGGGYYISDNVTLANNVASWDGTTWTVYGPDSSIGTNSTGDVSQFASIGDTLLALGFFSSMAGVPVNGIAMYHNGTWSSFGGGVYGQANAAISFDGKIYVGGQFTKAGAVDAMAAATYSNGAWTALGSMKHESVGWGSAEVLAIATSSRYIAIGGNFETIAGRTCNHIAVWDKQLQQWITLGGGVDGPVRSLAFDGDTLVVGGGFNHAGTILARHIAMCNLTTKLWFAMGGGAKRYVSAISVHNDSIFAPIDWLYDGSHAYDFISAWNGTAWTNYGNGLRVGYIHALAWEGSTLFVGGEFAVTDDGTVVNGVAQLQDGVWGALNSGLDNYVYALAISGDSLYVGGVFSKADGLNATALAVWNGNDWNPIGTGFNREVDALAADGHGGVYAGGGFTMVAGINRGNLVHWNGSSFGTVAGGVDNTVDALATDTIALYAGGWFETAGNSGTVSLHFGALDGAGAGVTASPSSTASWSVYPNPSSASSTISLDLANPADVRIELFNSLGSRIAMIANGFYPSGPQEFPFDASKLASGIYFLRLTSGGIVSTQHLVVERN